jgi:hypothetical protein
MRHKYEVNIETPILSVKIAANTDTQDDRIAPAITKIMDVFREFHVETEISQEENKEE